MIPSLLIAMTLMGLFPYTGMLKRNDPLSIGPVVHAQSVFVVSKEGQVLWSKNELEKRSVASLTKLMTALVILDHHPDWTKKILISKQAASQEPVNLKLHEGDRVSLGDLWNASLIASANDAIYALVEGVGLTEGKAVEEMNKKVIDFNLVNTHFSDVTGLNPNNISNAEDLAIIFSQAFSEPSIKIVLGRTSYVVRVNEGMKTARIVTVKTTNKLLGSMKGVQAGKTGYIEESGYNMAMVVKSPQGWPVYALVLGAPTDVERFKSMSSALAWTFTHYILTK